MPVSNGAGVKFVQCTRAKFFELYGSYSLVAGTFYFASDTQQIYRAVGTDTYEDLTATVISAFASDNPPADGSAKSRITYFTDTEEFVTTSEDGTAWIRLANNLQRKSSEVGLPTGDDASLHQFYLVENASDATQTKLYIKNSYGTAGQPNEWHEFSVGGGGTSADLEWEVIT